jgi:hypothetical protein
MRSVIEDWGKVCAERHAIDGKRGVCGNEWARVWPACRCGCVRGGRPGGWCPGLAVGCVMGTLMKGDVRFGGAGVMR